MLRHATRMRRPERPQRRLPGMAAVRAWLAGSHVVRCAAAETSAASARFSAPRPFAAGAKPAFSVALRWHDDCSHKGYLE
jgi:hypothetical protein